MKLRGRDLLLAAEPIIFKDTFGGTAIGSWWTVTDTESKISVTAGILSFSGGKASPAHGDPGIDLRNIPITRASGVTIKWKFRANQTNAFGPYLALSSAAPLTGAGHWVHGLTLSNTGGVSALKAGSGIATPKTYSANTWVYGMVVLKAVGGLMYVSDDDITYYPVWIDDSDTTATLYLVPYTYSGAGAFDSVTVKRGIAKPPVIDAQAPAVTLTLGGELAAGNLVVGNWYKITATQANYFYTGSAVDDTFRATATTALDANNKVKLITFSTTLSGGGDAGTQYGIPDADVTVGDGYQAGSLSCLDSASTPLYYLHAYADRNDGKGYLLKVVNGTTTELISAAITYSAAAKLRVIVVPGSSGLSNASVALYYNSSQVGTTQTVDLSSFGTLVRGFDTSEAATVDLEVNVA